MFKRFRHWLRHSSRVHIREPISNIRACVEVIDRFLDGSPRYRLEWDDFVSWEHDNPHIEATRQAIAETEPLFFSGDPEQISQGIDIVVRERNRLAKTAGIVERGGTKRDDDAA
jgi:hypothetical protein